MGGAVGEARQGEPPGTLEARARPGDFVSEGPDRGRGEAAAGGVPGLAEDPLGNHGRDGIRKGEAVQLRILDFDAERGLIRLRREITKTNRDRVCPLPAGLVELLTRYLEQERDTRPQRQRDYLDRIRVELRTLRISGSMDSRRGRSLSEMEEAASAGVGHQYLFANGKGLPLRRNLDREFRATLKRAGIERDGLCIHSLRYTANSTLLAAGIPEAVIRARMGHVTSKMTDRYFDPKADNGIGTDVIARLVGVPDTAPGTPCEHEAGQASRALSLEEGRPFRPTQAMLAALAERYSNIAIGKILRISEKAVRDRLKRAGIKRADPVTTVIDDWQVAIIRAELRAELSRRNEKRSAGEGDPT
ncbi:MAG: site-specific integrase [Isosphaeraceae bacterium]